MTKFKSQGLHTIRIKYWNAIGSGSTSFILAHWNIGILHYKQAKLPKDMQHSVSDLTNSHFLFDNSDEISLFQPLNHQKGNLKALFLIKSGHYSVPNSSTTLVWTLCTAIC